VLDDVLGERRCQCDADVVTRVQGDAEPVDPSGCRGAPPWPPCITSGVAAAHPVIAAGTLPVWPLVEGVLELIEHGRLRPPGRIGSRPVHVYHPGAPGVTGGDPQAPSSSSARISARIRVSSRDTWTWLTPSSSPISRWFWSSTKRR
jgi:hypothetical protein